MTIGAVCKALAQEFPDISISKIRYLEDQKLAGAAAHARRLPALQRLRRRSGCARSCACSATSSCRCASSARSSRRGRADEDGDAARRPPADGEGERRRGAGQRVGDAAAARCTRWRTCSRRRAPSRSWSAELEDYGVIKGDVRAGRQVLRRDRARDRPRGHRAGALRRRRAQPARVPHIADREAALLQQILAPALRSRNAERRKEARRGAREPRRGHDAPQAPAADPRPAQDRRRRPAPPPYALRDAHPRHPGLPEAGHRLQATSRRCWPIRAGLDAAVTRLAELGARPATPSVVIGAEARGFLLGAGAGARARRGVRPGAQAGQAAARRPSAPSTCSSTAPTRWSCTPTRSRAARACSSTTTCWPPAAPPAALCSLVEQLGGDGRRLRAS